MTKSKPFFVTERKPVFRSSFIGRNPFETAEQRREREQANNIAVRRALALPVEGDK